MKDSLGDRMKGYESVSDYRLVKRTPVIIRIDGKAFHTFTRGFNKPFDEYFMRAMFETAKALCEQIQCCKLAYTQSDEISLLLVDYNTLQTQPWFENRLCKMCSISASVATLAFNNAFRCLVAEASKTEAAELTAVYKGALKRGGLFDSRAYNMPREEVANYFLWRQNDATRNSILGVGQKKFSRKALQNKSCNDIQEMLFTERGINWNDLDIKYKRGVCVVRVEREVGEKTRHIWEVDENIPIFSTEEGRQYIERFVDLKN